MISIINRTSNLYDSDQKAIKAIFDVLAKLNHQCMVVKWERLTS
ncbi:MAG: hypothetical protein Ct9H300mP19_19850 [Dehalococcoidia bacterium]|nr:MAG: hypothetical protein Ct9H300mP19_19850 [Dehalococcoidia bacterium]